MERLAVLVVLVGHLSGCCCVQWAHGGCGCAEDAAEERHDGGRTNGWMGDERMESEVIHGQLSCYEGFSMRDILLWNNWIVQLVSLKLPKQLELE